MPPATPDDTRFIPLRHGRRLAYAQFGDPTGSPVVLFHGLPGSRIQRHPDDSIAARLGLRVLMPDRPGCGLSDPDPKRRVTDWPADLAAMLDALGIERATLGAWSGGAPYACAAAATMPDRIVRLALVSPMSPLDRPGALDDAPDFAKRGLKLAQATPFLIGPAVSSWHRKLVKEPEIIARTLSARLSRADRQLFDSPSLQKLFVSMLLDATQQGPQGLTTELKLLVAPWSVDLRAISATTSVWHGDEDHIVPSSMGRWMAGAIPGATFRNVPGGGHFVAFQIWEELLTWLGGR